MSTVSGQALADLADLAHSEGCATLDAVEHFLSRFIAYPSDHARHAHTLWLAHTWRMDAWESTLRLAFMSAEEEGWVRPARPGGKRATSVPRGVRLSSNDRVHPGENFGRTSCDPVLRRDRHRLWLARQGQRGPACAAKRGTPPWRNCRSRNVGQRHAGRAGLSGLLRGRARGTGQASRETVADRAVVIHMKKRKRTERVESWRERVNGPEAKDLGGTSPTAG